MEEIRKHIQDCEGKHIQQVVYSTYHDALTQICYGCKKIRTNLKDLEEGVPTIVSYSRVGKTLGTAINLWNFMKSAEKGEKVHLSSPDGSSEWERIK